MKNYLGRIYLSFFILPFGVHATTFTFEDQLESMKYAMVTTNSVAKIVMTDNESSPHRILRSYYDKLINKNKWVEWGWNFQLVSEIRSVIDGTGGIEAFIEAKKDHIKIKSKTKEFVEITIYKDAKNSEEDISFKFPLHISEGSANIIDVTSLGLPQSLQGYVFSSCVHNFTLGDEFPPSDDILERTELQIKIPQDKYTPDFEKYRIKALFYPEDYEPKTKADVVFGILERPVDKGITPLSLKKMNLRDLSFRTITINGYGLGGVKGSNALVNDGIKRAGMQNINDITPENNVFSSCTNGFQTFYDDYVTKEEEDKVSTIPTKWFTFSFLQMALTDRVTSNFTKRVSDQLRQENMTTGIDFQTTYEIKKKLEEQSVVPFLEQIKKHISDVNDEKFKYLSEVRLTYENILETGISLTYIKSPGIPIMAQHGHSGSGALLWNQNIKKFEIVGIAMAGTHDDSMKHIDLPREDSSSLEAHLDKLKNIFQSNQKSSFVDSFPMNKYTFVWPYAERFKDKIEKLLTQRETLAGVFKF